MKFYFWIASILVTLNGFSQQTVFKYEKKFRKGTLPKSYNSFTAMDPLTGDVHLTIADNKSAERFILDSSWAIKNHFAVARGAYTMLPNERFNTLQVLAGPGGELNLYNLKGDKFFINKIDYNKKEEVESGHFELRKKETAVACFTTNNILCLIISNKNEEALKFITNARSGGQDFDTINVRLNFPRIEQTAATALEEIVVLGDGERDLEKLLSKRKIYAYGDKVYITIDDAEQTYVTEVNLKSAAVKQHIFSQQYPGSFPGKARTRLFNSFLLDDLLVNGNVYNGDIAISFYDVRKGQLIANYFIRYNDSISFKNGEIGIEKPGKKGSTLSSGEFVDRIIKEGQLAFELSAKGDGEVELVIENCIVKRENKYSSGIWMGGGTISTPQGIITVPSTFTGGSFWNNGEKIFYKDVSCKGVFNTTNLSHIVGENNKPSISSLLKNELEELDKNDAISIFNIKGATYLGFYSSKEEAFVIKKMAN